MSRRELAEAVNSFLWRTQGIRREIDAHTIARYERGVVRWPGKEYRTALSAILGATVAELGFVANRQRIQAGAQRDVLAVNLISPFDPDTIPDDYLPVPTTSVRVGRSDVEKIREIARNAASLDNVHGGGPASDTTTRHLRALTPLLQGAAAPATRQALLEAIGNLAGIGAYSAFDIADYTAAERQFRFALWCADAAGSWELRAATLADMARKAAYIGNADGALSLIELAQVRSDRLAHTTRAMLCSMRAQFLSTLGRTDEALAEVSRADEHFAARAPEYDRPWMCYYDEAEHLGSTGKALLPVAVHRKRIDLAAPRIRKAIELQGPDYPRSRTFSLTRLATLTMTIGEPREAAALGMRAATEAAQFDSQRIRDELTTLADAAAPYRRITEVAELTNVIASTGNHQVKS
ncbi:XRE family transcriptional regulator [Nocardia sp. BSTN01]|uniref:XRE family transcriptional regulator n=1 Tax=Nocardia sp. BSTN01 TaxID=2783665 RepID=UPI0018906751|nr:XRE family transcriptional regulator [Nocardia sp. BSTN01]MBF5001089.1 XRE family transcriptional regulator [Nocardia sp. BSTN01]